MAAKEQKMAETTEKGKKTKAPARPRAPRAAAGTKNTAGKKAHGAATANGTAAESTVAVYVPSHEEIAFLALQYWEQRGREHGQHMQDWLRAEQDLLKMAS